MDTETIERAIDEELEKLSLNENDVDSENDTETEEYFTVNNGELENDFPESVLTYFEASRNRVNTFEQLIIEDLDEKDIDEDDTTYTELSHQHQFADHLYELGPEEDFMKLKERIFSEIEEHVACPFEVDEDSLEDTEPTHADDEIRYDVYKETERQLISEWRELEERLKKEEEQRLAEQEAERKRHLSSAREEKEQKKCRIKKFEEDLKKIESTVCEHLKAPEGGSYTEENLQLEVAKLQEVIKRLEEQIEEERHAYEVAHQEERRRAEERRCGATTKLQAAFRGALVRRWSKNELIKRREEERRRQEEIDRRREREERMKREQEEERRRAAEEERRQKEELERRRAEYERAKERERHRLERERKAEEQKRREEEAKRVEEERKRKEGEETRKRMEEERLQEEKRRVEEARKRSEEKLRQEEEKRKKELQTEQMLKEESKKLEKKERKAKEEQVIKSTEEKYGQNMEEKIVIREESKKKTEEQRMEEEKKSVGEQKCKEERKKKEELESELMQEEKMKKLAEEESKEKEEQVIKTNVRRDGLELEEETTRLNESIERKYTKEDAKRLDDQRCSLKTDIKNSMNSEKSEKEKRNAEPVPHLCPSQSAKNLNGVLASPPSTSDGNHHICSSITIDNSSATVESGSNRAELEFEVQSEKSETDTRGCQDNLADSVENCSSSSICLPDSTEQKRMGWMMNCTPWSKLSMQNKRKGLTEPLRKRRVRRASVPSLPPLPLDTVLKSGPWNTLRQVTTVTLEDLPGCSLSTLSECTSLQSLTLRRCGLQALEGLDQCRDLSYVDVQENSITYVDLGSLPRLEVLFLGRNKLTSIHGLDGAVNLTGLQLSYNSISRISGLGALKRLQRLSVDHNQLISTKGLCDVFTLLYLDCSYNHLSHMESLEQCALLHTLDLKGNSLTELPVLKNHVLLRKLYLDDNSISSLHGLDFCWLPLLQCLSVAQNNITQLPLLMDLLSLKTLDISHNCLSELRNICLSVQGCVRLQELNLTDNPLQQENNWRSSILAATPSLIKLNGDDTGVSVVPSVRSTQLWSFQALCQAHEDQLDSILQRHSTEISLASTVLHAQLLASNHSVELFLLAEEQRYAHEYGDSSTSDTVTQEPDASSCLPDESDGNLAKVESTQQVLAETETKSQPEAHLPGNVHQTYPEHPAADPPTGLPYGCTNPLQKFREESRHSKHKVEAPKMNLKTMAASVIQHCWRKHRQRRRTQPLEPPAIGHGRQSPQKRVGSKEKRPESHNKDYAATVIQAVWRGYALRRRLARALSLAQISEGDEAFEEVDMDEFVFDEEVMESDWIAPHSDASSYGLPPYSEQLLQPKPPFLPELHKSTPILPWKLKQAWARSEAAVASEQSLSPDPNAGIQSPPSTLRLSALSGRSEKILEEWGLNSPSTALLMLKRAQKMKSKKQQQRKLLEPAERLALFRKHGKQPETQQETQKISQPKYRDDIKAGQAELSVEDALNRDPGRMQLHRSHQWLTTQDIQTQISSADPTRDHFLPDIDADILNGGRVQLVAGTRYRESPDSVAMLSSGATGFFPSHIQQAHVRRHSVVHAKKKVPSPKRVTSAPSRKERISFRDNPVQLSGGWGGGKKRAKVNKSSTDRTGPARASRSHTTLRH